jgi:hypothetical protein
VLFAAAQAAPLIGTRPAHASEPLYLTFMAAHAVHFVAVARYAVLTGGRELFPGGRSMQQVGGWRTVLGIYTFFAGLAAIGWTGRPTATDATRRTRSAGIAANTAIGAMFTETYLRQIPHSAWYVAPTVMSGAVTILSARRHRGRTT